MIIGKQRKVGLTSNGGTKWEVEKFTLSLLLPYAMLGFESSGPALQAIVDHRSPDHDHPKDASRESPSNTQQYQECIADFRIGHPKRLIIGLAPISLPGQHDSAAGGFGFDKKNVPTLRPILISPYTTAS